MSVPNIAGRIVSPQVRYDSAGRLLCKVCDARVGQGSDTSAGGDAAAWTAHMATPEHRAAYARWRQGTGAALPAAAASALATAPVTAAAAAVAAPAPSSKLSSLLAYDEEEEEDGEAPAPEASARLDGASVARTLGEAGASRDELMRKAVDVRAIASSTAAATTTLPALTPKHAVPVAAAATDTRYLHVSAATAAKLAPRPLPSVSDKSTTSGSGGAAIPAGFFDDVMQDAKARKINAAALLRQAKEQEDAEAESFLDDILEAAEAVDEETHADYEERRAAAAAENMLYKARLEAMKTLHSRAVAAGSTAAHARVATAAGDDDEDNVAPGEAGFELVTDDGVGFSMLTTANSSASAIKSIELAELLRKRQRAFASSSPAAAGAADAAAVGDKRTSVGVNNGSDVSLAGTARKRARASELPPGRGDAAGDDDNDWAASGSWRQRKGDAA